MNVKVILEENKTTFEKELEQYLNEGYKVQSSNISFIQTHEDIKVHSQRPYTTIKEEQLHLISKNDKIKSCFYALLIKE